MDLKMIQLNALVQLWEEGGVIFYKLVNDSIDILKLPVPPFSKPPDITAYVEDTNRKISGLWQKSLRLEEGNFGLLRKEITDNLQRFLREENEHVYLSRINQICERQHRNNVADLFGSPIRIIVRAFYIPQRGRFYPFSETAREKFHKNYCSREDDYKKIRSILDKLLTLHTLFALAGKIMAMECQNSLLVVKNPERYPYLSVQNTTDKTGSNQEPQLTESGVKLKSTEDKGESLNVKILLAQQSGILDGRFHLVPPEKQYKILSILFGKTKGNVKNAITSLKADANNDNNPRNLPKVVERANDLITERDLGLHLINCRKEL